MIALPRLVPPVLIVCLGVLFFGRLVTSPNSMLYSTHSDFITYHVPYHHFLVHSTQQTGELPLWCPEIFAGMPGVQDPQVCAFYPLHLPLYWISEDHQGTALSFLVMLHVIIAGLGMFAYARHQQQPASAAFISALGYMFAGKWLVHLLIAGHHNLAPLAWLPLILLFMERSIARKTIVHATIAGVLFSLIILGTHPQITIYCGMFIAIWTFGTSRLLETPEPGQGLFHRLNSRWLLTGVGTAVVGGLLSAVQLWPAMEAVSQSSRSLGVSIGFLSLIGSLLTLIGFIGPAISNDATWYWEDRVCVGLVWLALAICAPLFRPMRQNRMWMKLGITWLLIGLVGLAMLQWVPGFHLWRLQSRTMFFLAIPLSLLVGSATQILFAESESAAESRFSFAMMMLRIALFLMIPLGFYAFTLYRGGTEFRLSAYWPWLVLAIPAMVWVIQKPRSRLTYGLWCLILLGDLWVMAFPWTTVIPEKTIYQPSECVSFLKARTQEHGRVLDQCPKPFAENPTCITPLWPNLGMINGIETVRGYNPLDILRYKQFLSLIEDRKEQLKAVVGLTEPVPTCIVVRNQSFADLLGVRYLLLPDNVPLSEVVPDPEAQKNWVRIFTDEHPQAYCFSTSYLSETRIISLPTYFVYENQQVLPRAFVVYEAEALADNADALTKLKATDFRRKVLIEGNVPTPPASPGSPSQQGQATIRDYQPNRVTIDVQSAQSGWLVLTDVWYPGWVCTIDGDEVPISRADYTFRGVPIPAGQHVVEFRLQSKKYTIGKWVSVMSLGLVTVFCFGGWMGSRFRLRNA
ncbi:MAG: YfhO family protein [Gemmataceae bacterium]